MADLSSFFTQPEQHQPDLWRDFDSYVSKFIFKIRSKNYMCDLVQQQNIPNGKAVHLFISKDGVYKEYYEILYSGLDIVGRRVQ